MQSSDESFRFCLGESFSMYSELQAKVKDYERLGAVQLTHQDSQYLLILSCVFGGKSIRTKVQDKEEHSCKCMT